jgi:hypothetical protein
MRSTRTSEPRKKQGCPTIKIVRIRILLLQKIDRLSHDTATQKRGSTKEPEIHFAKAAARQDGHEFPTHFEQGCLVYVVCSTCYLLSC